MLGVMFAGAILAAGAPPAAPAAQPAPKDPNALVCHSEPLPGSRLSTRVCMTAAEAERRRQMQRQELNSAQAQPGRPADGMMMPR